MTANTGYAVFPLYSEKGPGTSKEKPILGGLAPESGCVEGREGGARVYLKRLRPHDVHKCERSSTLSKGCPLLMFVISRVTVTCNQLMSISF